MLCFFFCCILSTLSASAKNTSLSISPYISHFDYQEFDGENELLNETGSLYGIKLSLNMEYRRLRSTLGASYISGAVDYHGRTQAKTPYKTTTQQNIVQYGASVGYRLFISEIKGSTFSIQPDIKLLVYHWRRDIQPNKQVARLVEDYDGFILQPSLIAAYSHYQLQAGLTRTFDNLMTIQPTQCIDRVTVKPKSGNSWFFQGEYALYRGDTYSTTLWTSYKDYKMKESNIKLGNTCFGTVGWREPDNAMKLWQLGVTFTF